MFFKKKSNEITTKDEFLKFIEKIRYRHVIYRKEVTDEKFSDVFIGAVEDCKEINGKVLKDFIELIVERRIKLLVEFKDIRKEKDEKLKLKEFEKKISMMTTKEITKECLKIYNEMRKELKQKFYNFELNEHKFTIGYFDYSDLPSSANIDGWGDPTEWLHEFMIKSEMSKFDVQFYAVIDQEEFHKTFKGIEINTPAIEPKLVIVGRDKSIFDNIDLDTRYKIYREMYEGVLMWLYTYTMVLTTSQ